MLDVYTKYYRQLTLAARFVVVVVVADDDLSVFDGGEKNVKKI